MNDREMFIVTALRKAEQEYVTCTELASGLSVSTKTVQKDIKNIRLILRRYGAEICSKSNRGYQLKITDPTAFRALFEEEEIPEEDLSDDLIRSRIIISRLLEKEEGLKAEDLCEEMFISRTRMTNDLKIVRDLLSEYHLQLSHKPYKGMSIVGNEVDKRKIIISEKLQLPNIFDHTAYEENLVKSVTGILMNILMQEHYLLSDVVIENLVFYLTVSINRIRQGMSIQTVDIRHSMIRGHELSIAEKIAKKIQAELSVSFSYEEVACLAFEIQSNRFYEQDHHMDLVSDEMEELVSELLEDVLAKHGLDFRNDIDLRISLALHLTPLILRLKGNAQLRNVMYRDIVSRFPYAFDIAQTMAAFISKKYSVRVTNDEAAYIAVYINLALTYTQQTSTQKKVLIVSSSRRGNTLMLRYMFMDRFKDSISQLDVVNLSEIYQVNFDEYDVIFTTSPEYEGIPKAVRAYHINYFLTEEDYEIIFRALNPQKNRIRFDQFFSEEAFYQGCAQSKEELLRKLVDIAASKRKGLNAEELYQSVLERESLGITCFENRIAIPHPNGMIREDTIIVFASLDKPLQWDRDHSIRLVFLVCVKENDNENLKKFYDGLALLLGDEKLVEEVLKCRSFSQILEIFRQMNHRLLLS